MVRHNRVPVRRHSRREEILRVAASLFAERGFHGVSVDEVGAAVGISGPALYHHFSSKEAMLAEMLVGISEVLLDEGRRRVAAAADPRDALDSLVRWHVEFALDQPALITVHTRDLANLPEVDQRRVRELQRRYVELWVDVIAATLPEVDKPRIRSATHAVFGLLNSTPHSARLGKKPMRELLGKMAQEAVASLKVDSPEMPPPTRDSGSPGVGATLRHGYAAGSRMVTSQPRERR